MPSGRCPSGQRRRSVKSLAQPTMVRIHPGPPSTKGPVRRHISGPGLLHCSVGVGPSGVLLSRNRTCGGFATRERSQSRAGRSSLVRSAARGARPRPPTESGHYLAGLVAFVPFVLLDDLPGLGWPCAFLVLPFLLFLAPLCEPSEAPALPSEAEPPSEWP